MWYEAITLVQVGSSVSPRAGFQNSPTKADVEPSRTPAAEARSPQRGSSVLLREKCEVSFMDEGVPASCWTAYCAHQHYNIELGLGDMQSSEDLDEEVIEDFDISSEPVTGAIVPPTESPLGEAEPPSPEHAASV